MYSYHRPMSLLSALVIGVGSTLQAEDAFDSLVQKLSDDRYEVRARAKQELLVMCREKPELTDRLATIIFNEEEEVEKALSAWDVVAEAVYVERGAIGITLDHELIVERMVSAGPAMESGIQVGSQLISIAGVEVKGKTPSEVYAYVHATRPGDKIEMEFVDKDGEKLLYYPVVAPRGTIRSDERPEVRRREAHEKWLEKQRERFQLEAD